VSTQQQATHYCYLYYRAKLHREDYPLLHLIQGTGLGGTLITEVARKAMRSKGFTREHVGKLKMQKVIMEAQLDVEVEGRMYVAQWGQRQVLLSKDLLLMLSHIPSSC
jgi:hypothetical protein